MKVRLRPEPDASSCSSRSCLKPSRTKRSGGYGMPAATKNGTRRARASGPYWATRSAIVAGRGAGFGRIGARHPAASAIAASASPIRRTVAPRPNNTLTRWPRPASRTLALTVLDLATTRRRAGQIAARHSFIEGEDALPVVPHADDRPALLLRLVVERLREGSDLGRGQALRRTIVILPFRVVVQHQHREPRAVAGLRVLEQLPV